MDVLRSLIVEEMGLEDGDVIIVINGYSIVDWEDIFIVIDVMFIG